MSLINENLSAMQVGTYVKITQRNGQVINGVVIENDGKESLALQITSTAFLRYDDISGTEQFVYNETLQTMPVQPKKFTYKKVEISRVEFDKETVSKVFKEIDSDAKKALNPSYNKYQTFLTNHDNDTIAEAMNITWDTMLEMELEYNPEVNMYYAYLALLNGDYYKSAESFFYGNNLRNAYCTAYHGAVDTKDDNLYALSAVFASIYIIEGNTENLEEATEVIGICSEKIKDLGALNFLAENISDIPDSKFLSDIIRNSGMKNGMSFMESSSIEKCLAELKPYYPSIKMAQIFDKYKDDIVKSVEDTVEPEEPVETVEEIDTTKTFTGKITVYKFTEQSGTITSDSGEQYPFELADVSASSLEKTLKKTVKKNVNIPVSFTLMKRMKKYYAVGIENNKPAVQPAPSAPVEQTPKMLFSNQKYNETIAECKKLLDTEEWEEAFEYTLLSYIRLWKLTDNASYGKELEKLIRKYSDREIKRKSTYEILLQINMKFKNYPEAISVANTLFEMCDPDEHGRMLNYLSQKERCYRGLKDYQSAVGQLLDWIKIVKDNKIVEQYSVRDNSIYIELAEVYFEMGDYENAEKYCKLSASNDHKKLLVKKLDEIKQNQLPEDSEVDDEEDEEDEQELIIEEQDESLQTAYEAYTDDTSFDELNITDTDIAGKINIFSPNQLYCLLTYLKSASDISASSAKEYTVEDGTVVYVSNSVQALNSAFEYAFNSPMLSKEYISSEVISAFANAKRLTNDMNNTLFASAVLHSLFNNQSVLDYGIDDFLVLAESYEYGEKYPSLTPLINTLHSFKTKTGYGIDIFADYKTNTSVMDKIIAEAVACGEAADRRIEAYESQGQVRRAREYMFINPDNDLRKCLDIAAANDVTKLSFVKSRILEMFIRDKKPLNVDDIDIKKIDSYIDYYWNLARDVILSEGRHVSRPHDKIKSGKRTNMVTTIKRMVSCICDWVAIAENSETNGNPYAKGIYEETAPDIVNYLTELIKSCESNAESDGFNWGNESLRMTAVELLSKMNGTYDPRTRKYMFIDFLRGDDILLNEKYLPELHSTFLGWKNFNILNRIEHHATTELISFENRITEILSDIESKHNFRSIKLIKNYGDDMQIESISEHKYFEFLSECHKQAKQRFEELYHDFSDEIEMYESYGRISDINGEKTSILETSLQWYKITRITCDYGFYMMFLDVIRNRIAVNASEQGERLKQQLSELADKPEYDFGVYPKESISAMIEDQNYTVAEYMLNCIRRHDTKTVDDYTVEPFSFFHGFMNEHQTNYRIVYGSGTYLDASVMKQAGIKNLERAMKQLTNNAMKDVKGGCGLINNWLLRSPAGADRIEKLLSFLGILNCTVTTDGTNPYDSYMVYCQKQTGKINYPHPIPAFSSSAQSEGFRVLCLYGKFNSKDLMETFRNVNTVAKHTIVLLDFAMNQDERRKLARKIKEEKSFARTFILIDRVILMYLAKHYTKTDINKMLMAVTMPFAYYQPFVEASNQTMPPELFTGREAELTSIESPEGANLVYGGRQLGKSALLKMAQRNIDGNANNDRAVLVEIKDLDYTEAAKVVSSKLVIAGILDEGCQCDDWNVLSAHIEKRLLDDNPQTKINYLLLMLDEADKFIGTSIDNGNIPITALKNLPSNRFKIVMAGLHNLSRYDHKAMIGNNSTLIHLNSIIVRPFQRPEAIKLLTNTLAYLGFRFKSDVISLILAKTNYFPGLIQLYCQKLIEAMKDDYAGYSEISTPSYEVTEEHFKKVLSDSQFMYKVNEKLEITLFTEETGHSKYHVIALILSYLCYTEPSNKGYTIDDIVRIAETYDITRIKKISREQLQELLHEMWDLNVLSSEGDYYMFATESFREMLGKQEDVEKKMSEYFGEGDSE